MKVWQALCYLCYNDGEIVEATHQYITPSDEEIDICEKHIEVCKKAKLTVRKLEDNEMIQED